MLFHWKLLMQQTTNASPTQQGAAANSKVTHVEDSCWMLHTFMMPSFGMSLTSTPLMASKTSPSAKSELSFLNLEPNLMTDAPDSLPKLHLMLLSAVSLSASSTTRLAAPGVGAPLWAGDADEGAADEGVQAFCCCSFGDIDEGAGEGVGAVCCCSVGNADEGTTDGLSSAVAGSSPLGIVCQPLPFAVRTSVSSCPGSAKCLVAESADPELLAAPALRC
mmetsp:Transcript_45224/g.129735  ORF Transcript_45224/g.129735 Transcript_45224/m.129735 type:complete len:220 (-) Transcript_45224:1265-1924(-)